MSHFLLPVRLCIHTLNVQCLTSKLSQSSLVGAHVMEEGKQAASFSFRQTQLNIIFHPQPTQAVSSFHGVILPQNQRTICPLHPAEKTNAALPMHCKARKEGGREKELCAFPASPSLQLCALARGKVTLSSYICGLKDYETERKWMVPLFSPPVHGNPFCLSWVLPLQTDEQQVRGDGKAFYLPIPEFRMCCFSCSS